MVFALETTGDVVGGEEKENGHERGILATEDSGGGMEGGIFDKSFVEIQLIDFTDGAFRSVWAGLDMRDDFLSVGDDSLGATEGGCEGEGFHLEVFLQESKGVVVRPSESEDGLVLVTDSDEAAGIWTFFEESLCNFPPGCIGVLCFVNEDKVILWKVHPASKRHPNHVTEVDGIGISD